MCDPINKLNQSLIDGRVIRSARGSRPTHTLPQIATGHPKRSQIQVSLAIKIHWRSAFLRSSNQRASIFQQKNPLVIPVCCETNSSSTSSPITNNLASHLPLCLCVCPLLFLSPLLQSGQFSIKSNDITRISFESNSHQQQWLPYASRGPSAATRTRFVDHGS